MNIGGIKKKICFLFEFFYLQLISNASSYIHNFQIKETSHIINLHTLITRWWPAHNFSLWWQNRLDFISFLPERQAPQELPNPLPTTSEQFWASSTNTAPLHCTSTPVQYHPFHTDSQYTFYLLVLHSYMKTSYHWMVGRFPCKAVQYGHSAPQDIQTTTFERALDIMGLQWSKQKDTALLFLITIFTIE